MMKCCFSIPTLWLLENGADTSIQDAKGHSALDCARKCNNNAILKDLKPFSCNQLALLHLWLLYAIRNILLDTFVPFDFTL